MKCILIIRVDDDDNVGPTWFGYVRVPTPTLVEDGARLWVTNIAEGW